MRPAAWLARRARDDLTHALSELAEIDGCDLAALINKRGYDVLMV